jgi:hypothetical protein
LLDEEDFDAVLAIKMDVVGGWDSNTHIAGSLNLEYFCRGLDCDEALAAAGMPIELPCKTKIAIAGSKTE